MTKPTILKLSRSEILERIEKEAQARLGMTAEDFVRRYRAGTLDSPGEAGDLIVLVNLLKEDDPLFAAV